MPNSHQRILNVEIKAAISLLFIGTACQFAVDVSEYRFGDRDAGSVVAELEPPPGLGTPGAQPEAGAGALEPPTLPALDAGSNDAPEPPEKNPSRPPLVPVPLEPEPEPEPPPLEPEPPPLEPEPPPPDAMYGCSLIEYCYAYEVLDTTDEEICRQVGCSLEQADAECRAEIAAVCGIAPLPPFVLNTISNGRVILN